jgi:hypothetical protein
MWQHTNLDALSPLGPPSPSLPAWLTALGPSEDQIRDTGWAGYPGEGYWPQVITAPTLGPDEVLTGDLASYESDPVARIWRGVQGKRPLTVEEIAARNPVPISVSAAQACLILEDDGILAQVEAVVSEMPKTVQIWYARANTWERDNPYVRGIGLELDLTDEQVDEMFRRASRRL